MIYKGRIFGAIDWRKGRSNVFWFIEVTRKFKAQLHCSTPRRTRVIMAPVKFDRRQGDVWLSCHWLARALNTTETDKLIRNANACKSLEERARQRYLDKSKNLTLETAIDICRMFEATKDGMQAISGEDQRVEVDKFAWRNGSTQRPKKPEKPKTP